VKKGITFQICVIIVILAVWNTLHFIYFSQKQHYEQMLEKIPVIAFSQDLHALQTVQSSLDSLKYIKKTVLEKNEKVISRIIADHKLEKVKNFLDKSKIPNVLKIYFRGHLFGEKQKYKTMKLLSTLTNELSFNNYQWEIVHHKINLLHKIYQISNLSIIIFLLFIFIFLRIHFEIKRDDFWKIFYAAGGKYNARRNSFILSSLFLCLLPLIFVVAAYYGLIHFEIITPIIPYNVIFPQIITLVLASIFSALFLGKRLL
jgi:hypothetical protein